jgi:dTDP-4-amino-4,6-dideoxygalactose transaminase
MTLDPDSVDNVVGASVKALVAVHLYGHPCDMDGLGALSQAHGLSVVEDCAPAHGAKWRDRTVGSFGSAAAFSFYPTKNLAALGDGGAVVTDEADVFDQASLVRQYGWVERQVSSEVGMNSRLDEIQAAVLSERLHLLDQKNDRRRQIADRYGSVLDGPFMLPKEHPAARSVYHQYVVRSAERDRLKDHLTRNGIVPGILYPVPLHQQGAFANCRRAQRLDVSENATRELLCLPIFPELHDDEVDAVAATMNTFS